MSPKGLPVILGRGDIQISPSISRLSPDLSGDGLLSYRRKHIQIVSTKTVGMGSSPVFEAISVDSSEYNSNVLFAVDQSAVHVRYVTRHDIKSRSCGGQGSERLM